MPAALGRVADMARKRKFADGGFIRDTDGSERGRTERNFRRAVSTANKLKIDGKYGDDNQSDQTRALKRRAGDAVMDDAWDEAESYDGPIHSRGRAESKAFAKGGMVKGKNARRSRKGM